MINKDLYLRIKESYGDVASWAVWKEVGKTPKSNMGDMDIFDLEKNPVLLRKLKNDVVMIGLNFSRPVNFTKSFQNFHDPSPHANDFKIRYAFKDTDFYGAYMTDVIKNTVNNSSKSMLAYLKENPSLVLKNISFLQNELDIIESHEPLILAFGGDAYFLLKKYLHKGKYSKLIKILHYSYYISKEDYKNKVLSQINSKLY